VLLACLPACLPACLLACLPAYPSASLSVVLCSIVGKRMQSKDVKNKLADVTANANRGDYRLQVSRAYLQGCL